RGSYMIRTCVLVLVCVCALGVLPAPAQTTFATITGTVTDSSGAAIPEANVVATHLDSNYRYAATSNATGAYTISQLREGAYDLRITAPGFKEFRAQKINLVSLDIRRIDAKLEVGTMETVVEVTAGATLIETETARISDSKDSSQLKTLPM